MSQPVFGSTVMPDSLERSSRKSRRLTVAPTTHRANLARSSERQSHSSLVVVLSSPGSTTQLISGWRSCPFAGDRPESSSSQVASIITLARI